MTKKPLRIGLIGYQFMGKAHSNAYRQVGRFFDLPFDLEMHTLCGRNSEAVSAAAEKFGWSQISTRWQDVIADPSIDVIDIATPGDSHCEIACAAAEAGKIVFCEKPLGNTLPEAKQMLEAVQKAGVANAIFHNYRKAPAVALAKKMIENGDLGTIYHFRATYLQDWIADPQFPLVWRLQKEHAGSGALGDIGAHIIDLGRHLVGEIAEVCGTLETFIKRRPLAGSVDDKLGAHTALPPGGDTEGVSSLDPQSSSLGDVTVDDAAMLLARFQNGALGTFEATRFAVGRKNYNRFEINGSKGSVVFNLERMNELEHYDNSVADDRHGFTLIQATESSQPYAGHYWPPGHIIGYEHTFINLVADALSAIHKGKPCSPDFADGYENQRILDAVERSHQSKNWILL